jgi:hypothetical protein
MSLDLKKLSPETLTWLDERASSRGVSMDAEAFVLLDDAIHERIHRERLFLAAAKARVRVKGSPLTAEEVEAAINWGRG